MSTPFRRLRLCLFCITFFTLTTAILRSAALLFAFDREIGYFATNSPFLSLIYVMVGICPILAFSLAFYIPRDTLAQGRNTLSTAALASSGVTALTALAVSITLIAHIATLKAPAPLTLLAFLLFFVASGYFFLSFLTQKQNAMQLPLGYAVILAAALLLAVTYFDLNTPMNAPRKISVHLCLLSVMLYMLYELRVLINRPLPRVKVAVSGITFFICGSMGLSNAVGFIAGAHDNVLYLVCDLFSLAFAFYVATRTLSTQIIAPQQAE